MIDKILEKFRYEFGDNQPDLEEFIGKVFEEQEKKYQNLTTSFNELAEIVKRKERKMGNKKEFWITPPEIYAELDQEFNFDFDPCPYPYQGFDGTEIDWGKCTYLNPPFRKSDGRNGKGPTAFIRKAIEENKKGKTVVILLNTMSHINLLISAGAEMRDMGRIKWLDGRTKEPWKSPSNTTCFILKGNQKTTQ